MSFFINTLSKVTKSTFGSSPVLLAALLLTAVACSPDTEPNLATGTENTADVEVGEGARQEVSDSVIKSNVEAAVARASDVPQSLMVEVREGVVYITGSLDCEECGGLLTPGNTGTVQQSLGAVVRAVSGVNRVEFDLHSGS